MMSNGRFCVLAPCCPVEPLEAYLSLLRLVYFLLFLLAGSRADVERHVKNAAAVVPPPLPLS